MKLFEQIKQDLADPWGAHIASDAMAAVETTCERHEKLNAVLLESIRAIKQEVFYGAKNGAADRIDAIATRAIAAARELQ